MSGIAGVMIETDIMMMRAIMQLIEVIAISG